MRTGTQHAIFTPIMMSEDLFLSKAFAQSMRPSKIIPFFYRAFGEFDKEDITLTTLVTSNRFKVFARLVENYQGEFLSVESHNLTLLYAGIIGRPNISSNSCKVCTGRSKNSAHLLAHPLHFNALDVNIR
jgi:hypothetical protein